MGEDLSPLTTDQIQEFAARLERTLAGLSANIGKGRKDKRAVAAGPAEQGAHDRGDESFAENFAEVGQAIVEHHEDKVRAVRAAILRIKDGTYGLCENCGDSIGINRLNAYPAASRCLNCQERAEAT